MKQYCNSIVLLYCVFPGICRKLDGGAHCEDGWINIGFDSVGSDQHAGWMEHWKVREEGC